MDDPKFIDDSAKGRMAVNFVKHLLEKSGYDVYDFGIETHNANIKKQLKNTYYTHASRILHLLPDLVVINPETSRAYLIEVKFRRTLEFFDLKERIVSESIKYWPEMFFVVVSNQDPYCQWFKCSDMESFQHGIEALPINVEKETRENKSIMKISKFNFYQDIKILFNKVTDENLQACLKANKLF
ncbi:hypothetical protein J4455_02015 [Candidatus Woesearchaeota archaeon]|nr:hypothetical protein [Candidatus Woesearchaeota archaeon]